MLGPLIHSGSGPAGPAVTAEATFNVRQQVKIVEQRAFQSRLFVAGPNLSRRTVFQNISVQVVDPRKAIVLLFGVALLADWPSHVLGRSRFTLPS